MGFARNRTAAAVAAAAFAATPAATDELLLKGGGRLRGMIVERTKSAIVVETGPGRVTLPLSRVETIVEGRSALEGYGERAAELASGDTAGWAALALWAAERDLATQSREAWTRVLRADPAHPEANAALGRVELDGAWVSEEQAWRARGYVPYEGRWVSPAEHQALVRQGEAEADTERRQREAELRVREAEARAREAEARAREAEAAAQPSPSDGGIPLWWGWGGGGVVLAPVEPEPPPPGFVHPPVVAPPVRPGPAPPTPTVPRPPPPPKHHPVKVRPPVTAHPD